jgi:hypothetical protein
VSSETELHANITTRGELEKEFHRLLSDGAESNRIAILANIAARAQLEKDFHRHLVERVAEVIDSFRSTILNIVEMGQHDEALYLRVDTLEMQGRDHEQRLTALEDAHGIRGIGT